MTKQTKLPPLPEMPVLSFDNFSLCYRLMKQYGEQCATAAIEADRQSQDRGDAFCVWHNDPETDNSWDTSCRQLFEIYDGTPTENGMKFCCYCGKQIREAIDHARSIKDKT